MCGIVGYVGARKAMPILMEGLGQLEYRGYDSAGIALQRSGQLDVIKRCGRLQQLRDALPKRSAARTGIGHTRWATHGEPSDLNAHPHVDGNDKVALVHNGIVENARELRTFLTQEGKTFTTETDTEVLCALVAREYEKASRGDLLAAVKAALSRISGTYGIAVLHADHPGELVVARNGSPVVLGLGENEMLAASDPAALVAHTRQVVYLDDGDVARLTARDYEIQNLLDVTVDKTAVTIDLDATRYERGSFDTFTLKEISEQPDAIRRVLQGRIDKRFHTAHFGGLNLSPKELLAYRRVKILGCGSAQIAGAIGASMIETLARIPADAESAAEFRYRNPIIESDTLYLAVSQSGETYDTLAAIQEVQRKGGVVLGVVNVVGSSIARQCGAGVYLHAGPEIAVVSTKTFASTLIVFALLALYLGRMRDLSPGEGERIIDALEALPDQVEALLRRHAELTDIAQRYAGYDSAYFVGRGAGYGLAREGALKLKEISYIHAEAYPASELKHGPLALIDADTPTVAVVPDDDLWKKNVSTLEEIRARGGPLLAIGQGAEAAEYVDDYFEVPPTHPVVNPVLHLVPMQLIAYECARARDCEVDKPRNLAKSVTVE